LKGVHRAVTARQQPADAHQTCETIAYAAVSQNVDPVATVVSSILVAAVVTR
jgi:hypothetical protein